MGEKLVQQEKTPITCDVVQVQEEDKLPNKEMQQNEKSLPKGTEQPLSDEMDEELLDYDYDYEPSEQEKAEMELYEKELEE